MRWRSGRIAGFVFFLIGMVCLIVSHVSVKRYTNAHYDNYVAPGGRMFPGEPAFRFAVLGDSGLRNTPMDAVLTRIREGGYAFAIHTGDMARRFTTSHFEWLIQELREQTGDMPFYTVPGNHDIIDRKSDDRLIFYKRAFGQPNYWFSYGDVLFLCLDTSTNDFKGLPMEWLETTLKRLRDTFKSCVLIMHVPPIDPRPGENHSMDEGVNHLREIVAKYRINALFAGHIHEYSKTDFGGAPLYIGPPAGETRRGNTTHFGYLDVSVAPDGALTVRHVPVTDKDGREHFEYFLSTSVQRYPVAATGIALVAVGFLLVAFSRKKTAATIPEA